MEYWCHICKREVVLGEDFTCSQCQNAFVEEIDSEEQHPRSFLPFYMNPARNHTFPEFIIMPSLRSSRAVNLEQEGDSGLDAIIHQIMMTDQNRYGSPPASKDAISNLKEIIITNEVIKNRGTWHNGIDEFGQRIDTEKKMIECSVCKEEFIDGEYAIDMSCMHLFHKQCIFSWLDKHNNCPTCRFELPTDDLEYEARRLQK